MVALGGAFQHLYESYAASCFSVFDEVEKMPNSAEGRAVTRQMLAAM